MPRWIAAATALAALIAIGAGVAAMRDTSGAARHAVPDLGTMNADELTAESYRVVPALLSRVYDAFARTDEAAIYDRLEEVAAGDALEALYLERVGAMADGGLEPDQTIHEMEMLRIGGRRDGGTVRLDARWRVLGTVGHAEHLHVRGNVYAAELVVEPVDGAWRMTGFTLNDVDRSGAGGMQPRPQDPGTVLGLGK